MLALKNSMNMSNEYRLKQLNDPINYEVSLRGDQSEISGVPSRYLLKERKIKQQDSFGGYRFSSDNLKKRTNPTEEYRKKLEQELLNKKKILSEYEMNGGHLSKEQLKLLQNSSDFTKNKSAFNLLETNDIIYDDLNSEKYTKNLPANESIIKVLDAQVDLLKRQSNDQFQKLINDDNNENSNHFFKTQRYRKFMNIDEINNENGLEEPKVNAQFLAINDSRVQTLKHVYTRDKPEYIPLEELEELKQEHEKELLDIEDEYYGRKKLSPEELKLQKELRLKLLREKQLRNMIRRPGYNNDKPLEEGDYEFINKYNNYLKNKANNYDKLGYEEEWNYTKIKSQNANGVVDRKDGQPGYIDQDDYKLYYYDIKQGEGEKNFERPLVIHKHLGKENTMKKTYRNEQGYETTIGKLYKTNSAPDFNTLKSTNYNNYNYPANEKNNNDNDNFNIVNNGEEVSINKSINFEQNNNNLNDKFIKLIFGMLTKNNKGEVHKNKLISEMKLEENAFIELGFKDKADFEYKLKNFPSKNEEYMTEEEFYSFLLHKNNNRALSRNNYNINKNENDLMKETYSPDNQPVFIKEKTPNKNNNNDINKNDILPGMSTSYFDFLKNPSTTKRLKHINKILKGKRSQSAIDNPEHKYKSLNKSFDFKKGNKSNRNYRLNKSYDEEKNNDSNNFNYASNQNFNTRNYFKKSDLNFTVPKPFEFLKEDYHGKKLLKMKEILEERKRNEDDIFNHTFHANYLNKRMFNKKGDLRNIIEREKSAREIRLKKKRKEIQDNMKPFSFYDKDFDSFVKRKNQECLPPKFRPFKANPIKSKSQVNMYDGLINNFLETRKERIHQRALDTFNAGSLPKRMEAHEKQKKLQEHEKLEMERHREELDKKNRTFKAQKAPKFNILHEKFINILEKKKKAAHPTVPKPFPFHEPKRKAELCQFLDFENNPNAKNPKKIKNIDVIRKRLQKKPKIEPPSTKSLKLLMDTRRKELENRKIREESIKREDEKRREKQSRLNQRVRSSSVMQTNKRQLEENRKTKILEFKNNLKENQNNYKEKLELINQKVNNRPLMMEMQVTKKDMINMKQNNDN